MRNSIVRVKTLDTQRCQKRPASEVWYHSAIAPREGVSVSGCSLEYSSWSVIAIGGRGVSDTVGSLEHFVGLRGALRGTCETMLEPDPSLQCDNEWRPVYCCV